MVAAAVQVCVLCGLPTSHPLQDATGNIFCCPACREVHALLQDASPAQTSTPEPTASAEVILTLGNLWCTSCAWLIDETLRRTPGVVDANISFVRREARITYDEARVAPSHLARRVKRLGYEAWLPGAQPASYDEEERLANRLLIGGVLAMHVMLISLYLYIRQWIGGAAPDTQWLADFFHLMLLIASTPLMLLLGFPILRAGVASLFQLKPNMHALIAIGAFAAFGLSTYNYIQGSDKLYFDTASVLLMLVTLGRWLEIRAQKDSRHAVDRLWKHLPHEATWITLEGERRVPVDDLPVGARIRVRPGERIAVDGIIAAGRGDVDESLLTGESLPVLRSTGDRALAGTISVDGSFEVVTSAVGGDTTAGQIGKLLHQALWEQAPIQQLVDRIAAVMVPAAVGIALLAGGFWTWQAGVETGLLHGLSVLLIACPCALGIATPLTLWLGIGRAAEAGVILRSGQAFERLAAIQHICFDKTGTLTTGQFEIQAIETTGMDVQAFLTRLASVEMLSEHPLGKAMVTAAGDQNLPTMVVSDFEITPGYGVSARLNGSKIEIGNALLMRERALVVPDKIAQAAARWAEQGSTTIYAGWDGEVRGAIALGEYARPETPSAIQALAKMDLQMTVLTGDEEIAGRRWAEQLGIAVRAGMLPDAKLTFIQEAAGPLLMVGDGINDGPSLAAAAVGVALSDGTDVARAAADAIVLNDDLRAIPWLIDLGKEVMKRVRQNLTWAFVYNILGIGLAAAGLLLPVLSALAMVVSSTIVTGNALKLRQYALFAATQRES